MTTKEQIQTLKDWIANLVLKGEIEGVNGLERALHFRYEQALRTAEQVLSEEEHQAKTGKAYFEGKPTEKTVVTQVLDSEPSEEPDAKKVTKPKR